MLAFRDEGIESGSRMEADRNGHRLHENDGKDRFEGNHDGDSDDRMHNDTYYGSHGRSTKTVSSLMTIYTWLSVLLLLINYFLAQFDKFILSYFQTPLSESLNLYACSTHSIRRSISR